MDIKKYLEMSRNIYMDIGLEKKSSPTVASALPCLPQTIGDTKPNADRLTGDCIEPLRQT